MHSVFTALGLTLLLGLTACSPRDQFSATAATPAAPATNGSPRVAMPTGNPWLDDGTPQSGLPRMKLYLGPKELTADLALTTASIQKGLMWRTNIAETESMLFVFGRPHKTAFWMKNVPMPIDVAYLDPEGTILEIHRMEKFDTNAVEAAASNVQYALETAEGWFKRNNIGPGIVVRTERGSLPETFFSPRRQ